MKNKILGYLNSGSLGAFLAVLLAGWIFQQSLPLGGDMGWLSYAAEQMLEGKQLYIDLVEVNPPLILYLSMIQIYIERLFDIHHIIAFRLMMFGFILLYVYSFKSLFKQLFPERYSRLLALLLISQVVVHTFLVVMEFGQRDQMVAMLFTLYVLSVEFVRRGIDLSIKQRLLIAVATAVAIGLKPYFITIAIAGELYLASQHKNLKVNFRLENILVVLLGGLYLVLAWFLHPAYFEFVIPAVSKTYFAFSYTLKEVLLIPHLVAYLLLLVCWFEVRAKPELARLWLLFSLASVAAYIGYFAQEKPWIYHQIPFVSFLIMAYVITLYSFFSQRKFSQHILRNWNQLGLFKAVLAFLLAFSMMYAAIFAMFGTPKFDHVFSIPAKDQQVYPGHWTQKKFIEPLNQFKGIENVYFMSTQVGPGFSLVNHLNARWASRFAHLWILPALIRQQERPDLLKSEDVASLEAYLRTSVLADMQKFEPNIVLVDASPVNSALRGYSVDILAFFLADDAFAQLWSRYRKIDNLYVDFYGFEIKYTVYQLQSGHE